MNALQVHSLMRMNTHTLSISLCPFVSTWFQWMFSLKCVDLINKMLSSRTNDYYWSLKLAFALSQWVKNVYLFTQCYRISIIIKVAGNLFYIRKSYAVFSTRRWWFDVISACRGRENESKTEKWIEPVPAENFWNASLNVTQCYTTFNFCSSHFWCIPFASQTPSHQHY